MGDVPVLLQPFQFDGICQTVSLTLCPLIGKFDGIEPLCYSRNVDFAGMLIFQPGTLIMDVIALFMTGIMMYHIKTKYTAVGRKEILIFFELYLINVIMEMLLATSIIPKASILYPYFTAAHMGLISATFWCLLLNGFLGFQFAEDGSPISLWSIRLSSFAVFSIVGIIAIATFNNWGPFNYETPVVLWVIFFIGNGAALVIYILSQLVLVYFTLDERWPAGAIIFGALFFLTGQAMMYMFSLSVCEQAKHHIDGLFFGSAFTLLAVMMVYKYWDIITKDDLEFALDSRRQYWQGLEDVEEVAEK